MIRRLRVRNFQRHRDLDLELDPGVTTIVGTNDRGKSAILRALRWVLTNRPRGVSFLRWGSNKVSVTADVEGIRVKRSKGSANTYSIDGEYYEAFGNDVPKEVADIVRVAEENFQGQHDAPFWFALPPGEVSRRLNAVVDLGLIDTTLANLASQTRQVRAERDLVSGRLVDARRVRKASRDVLDAQQDMEALEWLDIDRSRVQAKRDHLKALTDQALELQFRIACARTAVEHGDRVITVGEKWRRVKERTARLAQLVVMTAAADAAASRDVPDISDLEALEAKYKRAAKKSERLGELISLHNNIETTIGNARRDLRTAEKNLHDEMGSTCALCGQQVP